MTQKEFLTKVGNGIIDEEIQEFANNWVEKLSNRPLTKAQRENQELLIKVEEILVAKERLFANELAYELEVSTSKASALLKMLVEKGKATREQVVGVSSTGKKGLTYQYYPVA